METVFLLLCWEKAGVVTAQPSVQTHESGKKADKNFNFWCLSVSI